MIYQFFHIVKVIFSFEVVIGFAAVSPLGEAHTRGKADADKCNRMGL